MMKHVSVSCVLAALLVFLISCALAEPLVLTYNEADYPDGGMWLCKVTEDSAMEIRLPRGYEADKTLSDDEATVYVRDGLYVYGVMTDLYEDADADMKNFFESWQDVVCNGIPAVMGEAKGPTTEGRVLYTIVNDTIYAYVTLRKDQAWTEADEAEPLRIFSSLRASDKVMPTPTPEWGEGWPMLDDVPEAAYTVVRFGNDESAATFRVPGSMTSDDDQPHTFYGENCKLVYLRVSDSRFDEFTADYALTWEDGEDGLLGSYDDTNIFLFARALPAVDSWFVLLYGEGKETWEEVGKARCIEILDSFRLMDAEEIEQMHNHRTEQQ